MENFDELIAQARSQPLMREALAQLGVTLKKVGHGRNGSTRWQTATKSGKEGDFSAVAFFENHDGSWVAIDYKQRTGRQTLDALGVLTKLYGVPFQEAVLLLSGGHPARPDRKLAPESRTAGAEPPPVERTPFVPPPRAKKHNHAFAYLNQTRCIPGNVVGQLLHIGAVYESNISLIEGRSTPLVVFPIFNEKGENVGADSCSANSQFRYKHICAGSDPSCTWYIKNNVQVATPETPMFFCESAIDAISLLCLENRPGVYISMSGLKDVALESMTKRFGGTPVICTDNDEAGNLFREKHAGYATLRPQYGKDWNDELKHRTEHGLDFALKQSTQPKATRCV